jgi:ubiquitin-associated SH3 domain-containing protein
MPRTLPIRRDGHEHFALDTPLTEMGYLQAKICGVVQAGGLKYQQIIRSGRALKESANCRPTAMYVSPALRCVQTAVGLLKGMCNTTIQLCIEPSLFEWAGWFRPAMPFWMPPDELAGRVFAPFFLNIER